MRIVHICQRDDPATGGALRVAEALVKEQAACGLKVWILFLYGPPARLAAQFPPDQVICLRLHSSKQAWRGIISLRKAIRSIAPDIINSHDGITWPRLSLFRIGIPIVMHSHLPAWQARNLWERMAWTLICKTTDFLIGISRHTIGSWIKAGYPDDKIKHIPNGVDFERFRIPDAAEKLNLRRSLGLPEAMKILVWVGQINRHMKGSDRVQHVAFRLPEDTMLVIVGYGTEFDNVRIACKSLIQSGKILMTGTVFEPARYYMAADGFIFTSHYEPFGLVILEAMACGLPILAFSLDQGGGAEELLEEFQAVMVADDVDQQGVEAAIEKLVSNKRQAEAIRVAAKAKYNWREISDEVVTVYRSIISRKPLRVLVCQHGARHRYAIPRMLESAGVLSAFYTDSSAQSLLGKGVRLLGSFAPRYWQRLVRRDITGLPVEKVFSSDLYYLPEMFRMLTMTRKRGIFLYQQRHRYLSMRMQRWGLRGANVVYSMYHENLDFIRWAKRHGAKSVIDVYVSPLTESIVSKERELFADWNVNLDEEADRIEQELWHETVELADLLICPSDWVAQGVRINSPSSSEKIRVVPYGSSFDYEGRNNKPVKGRVLFAGRDPLRKGLHYLAQTASILKKEIPELDVRVAGEMPSVVVSHPICKDLNFLGQLNAEQMKEEYLSADVFVLPALSEGFAGVVAESIHAGCPVIVTRETGTPIVNEREGLIVFSRDVEALAAGIRRMVTDREFRSQCSRNCLEQISFYSEREWRQRLLQTLRECSEF
jgi:glycosyltransferase involved in cell wall biosynthesis